MTLRSQAILAVGFVFVSAALFNASVPLYVDEAYYWLWSKHLSLSYYDHPYMIAYCIKLCTLAGDSVWMIRLVNLIGFAGAAFFVYKTAEYLFDRRSALYALILFLLSPAVTLGLTITTPDTPLILFWSATLYFGARAVFGGKLGDFLLAGLAGGLALSSKYTAILLLASLLLYLLLTTPRLFTTARLYAALAACVFAFLPVIVWNLQNDFASFAFQFRHGAEDGAGSLHWRDDLAFFGGMAGMFNPVFFLLLLSLFVRKESYTDPRQLFLILPALLTILFFLYKGIYKKMELNWVAPAFVSGGIVVARLVSERRLSRTFYAGIALSLAALMVIRFPLAFALEGKRNPHNRLFGYEELARHLHTYPSQPLFADHLTLASILSYDLGQEVRIPTRTRPSQFDRWQQGIDCTAEAGLYVSRDDRSDELKTLWKHVELSELYTARRPGFADKSFYIYEVSN